MNKDEISAKLSFPGNDAAEKDRVSAVSALGDMNVGQKGPGYASPGARKIKDEGTCHSSTASPIRSKGGREEGIQKTPRVPTGVRTAWRAREDTLTREQRGEALPSKAWEGEAP